MNLDKWACQNLPGRRASGVIHGHNKNMFSTSIILNSSILIVYFPSKDAYIMHLVYLKRSEFRGGVEWPGYNNGGFGRRTLRLMTFSLQSSILFLSSLPGWHFFHQLVQSFSMGIGIIDSELWFSIECQKNKSCLLLCGTPREFTYSSCETAGINSYLALGN